MPDAVLHVICRLPLIEAKPVWPASAGSCQVVGGSKRPSLTTILSEAFRSFPRGVGVTVGTVERSVAGHPSGMGGGEVGALARALDWGPTSLGSIETWPQSLRTAVGIVLLSPVPIVLLWGEDGIMIYTTILLASSQTALTIKDHAMMKADFPVYYGSSQTWIARNAGVLRP